MPAIIAYTWEAAIYCVQCTRKRFADQPGERDACGVPYDAIDREGNPIFVVFDTTELLRSESCHACSDEIYDATPFEHEQ